MHRSEKRCLISDLSSQLKTDSLFHPEVYLSQSQGNQCCQYPSEQFGVNRYRHMCCARHGCFVPHLVVDFQKGERYVKIKWATDPLPILHKHINMDYSICNALYTTQSPWTPHWSSMMCLPASGLLTWLTCARQLLLKPPTINWSHSCVGNVIWQLTCLDVFQGSAWTLSRCWTAGWGDPGDTLVRVNKVSASAWSMSKAHRAELHDDTWGTPTGRSLWAWVSDSFISSLCLDHYSYMAILALISQKVPKGLGRFVWDQGCLSRLGRLPLWRKNSGMEVQETQASRHRGDAPKIYEVHQEKVLLWVYELNADSPMQCHHMLTSDWS